MTFQNNVNNAFPGGLTVGQTTSAATNELIVQNTSATASSDARHVCTVQGASGGDPFLQWNVAGATSYSLGLDNSDSDILKVRYAASNATPSSGTELMRWESARVLVSVPLEVQNSTNAGMFITTSGGGASSPYIVASTSSSGGVPIFRLAKQGGSSVAWCYDAGDTNRITTAVGDADFNSTILAQFTRGGVWTFPLQPAFLANRSTDALNVTGNGAVYTIVFDNEIADQSNSYDPATGIFTAPVTGKYVFSATVRWTADGSTPTSGTVDILTTSRTDTVVVYDNATFLNFTQVTGTVMESLTAGDTVRVRITLSGTTLDCDVLGNGAGGELQTYFSGYLAC